jgi:hypothetical protein
MLRSMREPRPTSIACAAAATAALALLAALAAADDSAAPNMGGVPAGADARRPVVHDPAYFRDKVLPLVGRHCIECHADDDAQNKSKNRLARRGKDGAWSDEAVERNYKDIVKFLDPTTPERSTVLLKLSPIAMGGIDHDGGKCDDEHFPRDLIDPKGPLVAWIFGATATSAPPIAVAAPLPRTVTFGDAVDLDATLSFDPDGDPVSVTWDVVDSPQNARAKVEDPAAKKTRIVPDREGPWVVRCRPNDGRLSGWPARLRFSVVAKKDSAGASAPPPVAAADVDPVARRYTRELFLDLQGRTPTEEELARWAALPVEQRVDKLLAAPETWRNWVDEEAFYFLLIDQFRPVSDRLAAVPDRLAKGETTFREVHHEFALSPEFNARNPGNDTFVTVLFEQFLGMEVQKQPRVLEAGKKMYDGTLARIFDVKGDSQSDVVKITLAQSAYVDVFLKRMELRFFGEPLPKSEHDATLSLLASDAGLFRQILRDWLLSERYGGAARAPKAKNDRQFIKSLFVDLIGRPPSYEEFRNMRNALQAIADPKPLRGVLARVLLDSGAVLPPAAPDSEPEAQIRELFRRLLGRDPERRELAAFAQVVRSPGTTWRTAAFALLTSPHYQYY